MAVDKGEKDLLAEISTKLDRVIGLLAAQGKELDVQISILTGLGFSSSEIGTILGLHPGYIRRLRTASSKRR